MKKRKSLLLQLTKRLQEVFLKIQKKKGIVFLYVLTYLIKLHINFVIVK